MVALQTTAQRGPWPAGRVRPTGPVRISQMQPDFALLMKVDVAERELQRGRRMKELHHQQQVEHTAADLVERHALQQAAVKVIEGLLMPLEQEDIVGLGSDADSAQTDAAKQFWTTLAVWRAQNPTEEEKRAAAPEAPPAPSVLPAAAEEALAKLEARDDPDALALRTVLGEMRSLIGAVADMRGQITGLVAQVEEQRSVIDRVDGMLTIVFNGYDPSAAALSSAEPVAEAVAGPGGAAVTLDGDAQSLADAIDQVAAAANQRPLSPTDGEAQIGENLAARAEPVAAQHVAQPVVVTEPAPAPVAQPAPSTVATNDTTVLHPTAWTHETATPAAPAASAPIAAGGDARLEALLAYRAQEEETVPQSGPAAAQSAAPPAPMPLEQAAPIPAQQRSLDAEMGTGHEAALSIGHAAAPSGGRHEANLHSIPAADAAVPSAEAGEGDIDEATEANFEEAPQRASMLRNVIAFLLIFGLIFLVVAGAVWYFNSSPQPAAQSTPIANPAIPLPGASANPLQGKATGPAAAKAAQQQTATATPAPATPAPTAPAAATAPAPEQAAQPAPQAAAPQQQSSLVTDPVPAPSSFMGAPEPSVATGPGSSAPAAPASVAAAPPAEPEKPALSPSTSVAAHVPAPVAGTGVPEEVSGGIKTTEAARSVPLKEGCSLIALRPGSGMKIDEEYLKTAAAALNADIKDLKKRNPSLPSVAQPQTVIFVQRCPA